MKNKLLDIMLNWEDIKSKNKQLDIFFKHKTMKIKRSNKGLSQREMSKLINNKNTINLSSIERRKNARYEKRMKALKFKGLIVLIIITIGLGLFQIKVYGDIENLTSKEENIPLTTDEYLEKQTKAYTKEYRLNMSYEAKLFKFVEQGEGAFQSNAFCDDYYRTKYGLIRKKGRACKRWSIGYGTKSYRGEKITKIEAIKRRDTDILKRNKLITSKCLTDNQRIVSVDYLYQHGVNSGLVKHYANTCQPNRIYSHIVWLRDKYRKAKKWGLVKREQLRINLFYNI